MGLTSNFKAKKMKQYPVLQPKPKNPSRLHMSFAEALADSNLIKLAREKAKETEQAILKGATVEKSSQEVSQEISQTSNANEKSVQVKDNPFVKKAGRPRKIQ